MTILVCPVRPGDDNEELRYALRSWETNLVLPGGLELVTVGHCPSWLNPDSHVDGNAYSSVPLAVWNNIKRGAEYAAEQAWVDEAVFMNDDFFCLDPVGAILPVKRNITLAEHCALTRGQGWWGQSLDLTASFLAGQGFPSPDSYEVHRPFVARPEDMLSALDRFDLSPEALDHNMVPQWRTICGVLNQIDAHPVADSKLGANGSGYGTPWISTSDQSWRKYGPPIKRRFQKRSRWEKG